MDKTGSIKAGALGAMFGLLFFGFAVGPLQAKERVIAPPPKIAAAVAQVFPGTKIIDAEREYKNGVMFYDVNLSKGRSVICAEIAPDGSIGDIRRQVRLEDIPQRQANKIRETVGGGRIKRIVRHYVRGVLNGAGFKTLPAPRISYEVEYFWKAKEYCIDVLAGGRKIVKEKENDDPAGSEDSSECASAQVSGNIHKLKNIVEEEEEK